MLDYWTFFSQRQNKYAVSLRALHAKYTYLLKYPVVYRNDRLLDIFSSRRVCRVRRGCLLSNNLVQMVNLLFRRYLLHCLLNNLPFICPPSIAAARLGRRVEVLGATILQSRRGSFVESSPPNPPLRGAERNVN